MVVEGADRRALDGVLGLLVHHPCRRSAGSAQVVPQTRIDFAKQGVEPQCLGCAVTLPATMLASEVER